MGYDVNIDLIKEYMKDNKCGIRNTAKRMGVDHSYLMRVINRNSKPGRKIIDGMLMLGFEPEDIYIRNNISIKRLWQDMNSLCLEDNKKYEMSTIYNIMNSISIERRKREKEGLNINANTAIGKSLIYDRVKKVAKDEFNENVTIYDIKLFKKCEFIQKNEIKLKI